MADKIEINYDMMMEIQNKFSDKAEQMMQLKQILENQINELRSNGFIGQGANAFYAEMDEMLLPSMQRLIDAMFSAEQGCKSISNEFEQAEQDARDSLRFDFDG